MRVADDNGTLRLLPSAAEGARDTPKDIPALPQDAQALAPAARMPLEAMRAAVQGLLGTRGNPLDQAITLRLARALGMVDLSGNYLGAGGTTYIQLPGGGGAGGESEEPDLTPPPNVPSLTASGAFTHVIVEWPAATYTQGHGHQKTNLYAVKKAADDPTQPTAGDAVLVAEATGALTVFAIPSEPATRWHLWAKYETNDGVESPDFAGGLHGAQATTGQDVALLIKALSQSITESALHRTLLSKINAIEDSAAAGALATLRAALSVHRASGDAAQGIVLARQELTERIVMGEVAEATARLLLAARLGQAEAGLISERTARATADGAFASDISGLEATVYDLSTGLPATRATLLGGYYTKATIDAAFASATSTLRSEFGEGDAAVSASLSTEATTRATADGFFGTLYTVRAQMTAGGRMVMGGFGLSGTSSGTAGPKIDFGVLANTFWVGAPDDGGPLIADALPFVIQATATTINGVSVARGTYIDVAFIRNGDITNAKIGSAAIDDAKIANLSAAKLTAGDGTIGGNLKSANFVSGSAGWLVQPNGYAEFSNAIIRGSTYTGTIYAGAGAIGGLIIQAGDLRSSNYVPGTSGLRINASGYAEFSNVYARGDIQATSLNAATGTFTGSLYAATGTFAGSLLAATGTFSGALAADAVNAVSTINLAGNAVTVPGGGQVFGTGRSVVVTMSRTSRRTIATITTSAAGAGNVTLWVRPIEQSEVEGIANFNPLSALAVSGTGQLITFRFRVYRSVGGIETVVYERTLYNGSSGGTPTLLDYFGMLADTPGPGVSATYIYETHTSVPDTATNMDHQIFGFTFAYVEFRR